jgi:tetratricopeptide (TPR) repeat protein
VDLLLGIAAAIVLGVLLGVLIARYRARVRPGGSPPHDVAGLLRSYRHGHHDAVVRAAPEVVASLGATTGTAWRSRVELVWGHSLFELDRYDEAIVHLQRGLDESPAPQEAESRFLHCLGYAQQKTGRIDAATRTYERLLADPDLDPSVRSGVERNLAELRSNGSGG